MKQLLAGLLLIAHMAAGQTLDSTRLDSLPGKSNFRYSLSTDIGITQGIVFLPALRGFLQENRIEENPALNMYFTGGITFRKNRVKWAFYGNQSISRDPSYSTNKTTVVRMVSASMIGLSIGYDVLNSFNRRLYIGGGVGGANQVYSIYRQSTQSIPFKSVLSSNQTGLIPALNLQNAGYFEAFVEYSQREKRRAGVTNVLRLGYRTATYHKAWESDAFVFTDPITDRYRQLYFQATFAFSTSYNKFRFHFPKQ